jgi:O-antigen/teichoic acid export membrane protein
MDADRPASVETPPASTRAGEPGAGPAALRGGMVKTGGYVAGLLLGLISGPLIIRHLGIVEFGRYMTVVSIIGLVGGLTEGGLNAIGQREWGRTSGDERWTAMRDLLGMRLVLSGVGAAVAVAFTIIAGYGSPIVWGTVGAGIALLLHAPQLFLSVSLQGDLRFGWVTLTDLLRQALTVITLVVLVILGAGLVPILWASIPAGILGLILAAALVHGRMPLRPAFHWARWRPVLRDAAPYAIAIAVGVAYFRAAMLIVSLVSSDDQTGYFATSFRIVELLLGIPTVVLGAAFPILVHASANDEERFAAALGRILELALVVGVLFSLVTALAAPVLIHVLAGSGFDPSVPVLRVQAIALAANFVGVAAGYGLLSAGRNRDILLANAVGLSCAVALNLGLASASGAQGAAYATAAAEWILTATMLAALALRRPEILTATRDVPFVVLALTAALLVALPVSWPGVVTPIVGGAAFIGVLVATRRFPPEVLELTRSLRRRAAP